MKYSPKHHLENIMLWITGFWHLSELHYKSGWGPWLYLPVYILDVGTHVLVGGAVVTWSRWSYENRHKDIAGFLKRILNHIQAHHAEDSAPALWGSRSAWE